MLVDKPILGEDTYLDPSFVDGLVGCWLFNEGSGNKVCDLSGNRNGLDFVNSPVWSSGKSGSAILFDDGSSQYLHRSGTCGITGYPFSMVCWFNSNDQSVNQVLMGFGDANANVYHTLYPRDPPDSDIIAHSYVTSSAFASTTKQWTADTWHMAVGVWANAQDRRVYIDGGNEGTNTVDNKVFGGVDTTTIGCRFRNVPPDATYDFFVSGRISSAMIYNCALSASEIALLYREPFWGFKQRSSGIYTRI